MNLHVCPSSIYLLQMIFHISNRSVMIDPHVLVKDVWLCDVSPHTFEHFAWIPSWGMLYHMVLFVDISVLRLFYLFVSWLEVSRVGTCYRKPINNLRV